MSKIKTIKGLAVISLAVTSTWLASAGEAFAKNMNVRVYNNSSLDIYSIKVSPPWNEYDGDEDILGRRIIPSGYNLLIDFDVDDAEGVCVLDIKAQSRGGTTWRKKLDVCRSSELRLGN